MLGRCSGAVWQSVLEQARACVCSHPGLALTIPCSLAGALFQSILTDLYGSSRIRVESVEWLWTEGQGVTVRNPPTLAPHLPHSIFRLMVARLELHRSQSVSHSANEHNRNHAIISFEHTHTMTITSAVFLLGTQC